MKTKILSFGFLWALSALLMSPLVLFASSGKEDVSDSEMHGRIECFIYHPYKVYTIYARVGSFTNIEVPSGEQIIGFYLSDTTFWRYVVAKDQSRVLVKAGQEGMINSGTLVTNRRVYELTFVAVGDGKPWHHRVQWNEMNETNQAWGIYEPAFRLSSISKSPTDAYETAHENTPESSDDSILVDAKQVNFGWKIEGNAPFRPLSVFDDGKFTYIRMPNVQDFPAVFVEDRGKLRVVDYAVKGDTIIIHRISDAVVLRLDKDAVRAVRK